MVEVVCILAALSASAVGFRVGWAARGRRAQQSVPVTARPPAGRHVPQPPPPSQARAARSQPKVAAAALHEQPTRVFDWDDVRRLIEKQS